MHAERSCADERGPVLQRGPGGRPVGCRRPRCGRRRFATGSLRWVGGGRRGVASVVFGLAACVTVGFSFGGAGQAAASAWTIQQTPNPAGLSGASLNSVSCTSARACTAVGSGQIIGSEPLDVSAAIVERWNGRRWAIQRTPPLRAEVAGDLMSVSCSSATACTAVGVSQQRTSGLTTVLVERWDGSTWAIQRTPTPPGIGPARFVGGVSVSCATDSMCVIAGYTSGYGSSPREPLVERWIGRRWSIQRTPTPRSVNDSALLSVSCTSVTACIAVGRFTNQAGRALTLAERWNGRRWSLQSTPNARGLSSVSCASATVCMAVGFDGTFAERWDGVRWSIRRAKKVNPFMEPSDTGFRDVSCSSARNCVAVGAFFCTADGCGDNGAVAERWNGRNWSIQSTPQRDFTEISGVSCTSATACVAVGDGFGRVLAENYS